MAAGPMTTYRPRVRAVRDPDTRETIGWATACQCGATDVRDTHRDAFLRAVGHVARHAMVAELTGWQGATLLRWLGLHR